MEETTPSPSDPAQKVEPPKKPKSNRKKITIIALLVLSIVAVCGFVYAYQMSVTMQEQELN